ncbi:MAG: SlyX family protein [Planctomycetaceae bacterium]|nr:SlyX family protein [Planctomycetaceae bacterium]
MATDSDNAADFSHRLLQLEETVCHDQRLIEELNRVVIGLRLEIERLQNRLQNAERNWGMLDQRVRSHEENLPHEKPPHY